MDEQGTQVAEAPELGIGPQIVDPAHKPEPPPPMFRPEGMVAAPPQSPEQTPETGPAPASEWTWSKADLRRGKPADVPEEHREEFTRLQKQFKDVQGERYREAEDLRRREEAVAQQMREIQAISAKLAQAPVQTPETRADAGKAMGKIAKMLEDPDLEPDTKAAIELMMEVFEERFQERVGDRFKVLDEEVLPVVQKMGHQEERATTDAFVNDRKAAYEQYGADEVNAYGDQIVSAMGLEIRPINGINQAVRVRAPWTNPATGQPHTVTTLYELLSGKTAEAAVKARLEDERLRTQGKRTAPPGASVASPPSAALSDAEALSQVAALMGGIPQR